MARSSVAADDVALTALQVYDYQSMHTADPSTTGASEATGGGYGRQIITWTTPASSAMANNAALTQTLAAATYYGTGHWTAITSGTYGFGALFASTITLSGAGTITFAIGADSVGAP
jgi:hypothetical protein